MYFWCVCGEESDLHVLLLHHLEGPPIFLSLSKKITNYKLLLVNLKLKFMYILSSLVLNWKYWYVLVLNFFSNYVFNVGIMNICSYAKIYYTQNKVNIKTNLHPGFSQSENEIENKQRRNAGRKIWCWKKA